MKKTYEEKNYLKQTTITLNRDNQGYIKKRTENLGINQGNFVILCVLFILLKRKHDLGIDEALVKYCKGEITNFEKNYSLSGKKKQCSADSTSSAYYDSETAKVLKFRIGCNLSKYFNNYRDLIQKQYKIKISESKFYIAVLCYCRDRQEPHFSEMEFSDDSGLCKKSLPLFAELCYNFITDL